MANNKRKSKEVILKENLPEFVRKINPVQLLPYLPCLPQTAVEQIQAIQNNHGRSSAVLPLYQQLIVRSNKWFEELTQALRSECINQPELADLLDPEHKDLKAADLKEAEFKHGEITFDTPLRELNNSVLEVLVVLDHEGPLQTWRDLASILGYSMDQVIKIESVRYHSYTRTLLKHWMQLNEANLGSLLHALEKLKREDLISEIENITKLKYPRDAESEKGVQSQSDDVILFHRSSNQRTEGTVSCNESSTNHERCNEETSTNSVNDHKKVRCIQSPGSTGRFRTYTSGTSSSNLSTDGYNQSNTDGDAFYGNSDKSGACNQSNEHTDRCTQEINGAVACFGQSGSVNDKNQRPESTESHSERNNAKQDNILFSENNKHSQNIDVKDTEIFDNGKHEMEHTNESFFQQNGSKICNSNICENLNMESYDINMDQSKPKNSIDYYDSKKETLNWVDFGQEKDKSEKEAVAFPVENINCNDLLCQRQTTLSIKNPAGMNIKSSYESYESNSDYPMNGTDELVLPSSHLNLPERETTLQNQETQNSNFISDEFIENIEDEKIDSINDNNLNKCDKSKKCLKDKIIDTANSLGCVGTGVLGVAGITTLALILIKKL